MEENKNEELKNEEKTVNENCKEDNELNQLLDSLTDFQYFLMMANLDAEINQKAKEAFRFFTHENVIFSLEPAQIIIGPLEEKHLLLEENFYDFRRILKKMYFIWFSSLEKLSRTSSK